MYFVQYYLAVARTVPKFPKYWKLKHKTIYIAESTKSQELVAPGTLESWGEDGAKSKVWDTDHNHTSISGRVGGLNLKQLQCKHTDVQNFRFPPPLASQNYGRYKP